MNVALLAKLVSAEIARTDNVLPWWLPDDKMEFHVFEAEERRDSILSWLMAFAGLGWLTFLSPLIAKYLSLYIEVLGILAEASLMLWLLVMGVNLQRWKEQASAAGASTRT